MCNSCSYTVTSIEFGACRDRIVTYFIRCYYFGQTVIFGDLSNTNICLSRPSSNLRNYDRRHNNIYLIILSFTVKSSTPRLRRSQWQELIREIMSASEATPMRSCDKSIIESSCNRLNLTCGFFDREPTMDVAEKTEHGTF